MNTAPYSLEELIEKNNEELYKYVSEKKKILLNTNAKGWSEETTDGCVIIGCSPTDHPQASFAHELLHAKLKIMGMKDPLILGGEGLKYPQQLERYLYNQLAHHKMHKEFISMGYMDVEFLHDDDTEENARQLERDIAELEKKYLAEKNMLQGGLQVGIPYLASTCPHDKSDKPIIMRLRDISESKILKEIDKLLEEWRESGEYSPCHTMKRFCEICGVYDIEFLPTK